MIKAVLFDLDDTLIDRSGSLEPFLEAQFARHIENGKVDFALWHRRFLELDGFGYTPRLDVYCTLVAEFGLDIQPDIFAADHRTNFGNHSVLFPGTKDVLALIADSGIKLGIVTNGSTVGQTHKIRMCALNECVDAILISERQGLRKPDPAIFLLAAEKLGAKPQECVFVGDHPLNDITGAMGAGMAAVWCRRNHAWPDSLPKPKHAIDRIADLLPIVESLNRNSYVEAR